MINFLLPVFSDANAVYLYQVIPPDTVKTDTVRADTVNLPYQPSRRPTFKPVDRYGDRLLYPGTSSPLFLQDPALLKREIYIDTALNYTIKENMGDLIFRPPSKYTFKQYNRLYDQKMLRDYWKEKSRSLDGESAVSSRRLIPPIYLSPKFDAIKIGNGSKPTDNVSSCTSALLSASVPEPINVNTCPNVHMRVIPMVAIHVSQKHLDRI